MKVTQKKFVVLAFYVVLAHASVLGAETEKQNSANLLSYGAVPSVGYSSHTGFGFGAAGTVFKRDPKLKPYKWAVDASIYVSTKGTHTHAINAEGVELFELPLRLRGRVGLYASINQSYCGQNSSAICDLAQAQLAAQGLGLAGEERERFIFEYTHFRFIESYGLVQARWRLKDFPHKLEILNGWRGSYFLPGDFYSDTPYKNSLYTRDFGEKGERGFISVFEVGFIADNRDNEVFSRSGYWAETSVRVASPWIGSKWTFLGTQLALRGYIPLSEDQRWVLANQFLSDFVAGYAPIPEMARVGGLLGALNFRGFGGQYLGRGMPQEFIPGRVKISNQIELRYLFWGFDLWSQHFDLGAVTFLDTGLARWDWSEFLREALVLHLGFGGGLRAIWNNAYLLRADVAFSPDAQYEAQVYVNIGSLF